jgi:Branched-chain amino acid transport protein (AzlD).
VSFSAIEAWWWPYLFILVAGWLATDFWRFLGVYLGGRISEDSELLVFVRSIATALVAAVIANLVVFPNGALAAVPLFFRILAALIGFLAYLAFGKRVIVGIAIGEIALGAGMLLTQG